jgi:hypothetical protein
VDATVTILKLPFNKSNIIEEPNAHPLKGLSPIIILALLGPATFVVTVECRRKPRQKLGTQALRQKFRLRFKGFFALYCCGIACESIFLAPRH